MCSPKAPLKTTKATPARAKANPIHTRRPILAPFPVKITRRAVKIGAVATRMLTLAEYVCISAVFSARKYRVFTKPSSKNRPSSRQSVFSQWGCMHHRVT